MIPRELLKKIRKIEIQTRRLVQSQLAGQYHSVFKGRGVVFEEVRPYSPGDEVRTIDWNVSARLGQTHVKVFREERDRTVMLLVDMSASGLFGSFEQSKREIAAEIAALIAFSAIHNNDHVGLIACTDSAELFVPPKKGRKHVLRVIRDILSFQPESAGTDLAAGFEYLRRVAKRRTVTFVISDFLADNWEASLRIASRRHDIVPVVIADPMEREVPNWGIVTFEDLETGELYEFDTSGPEAALYADAVSAQRGKVVELFRRLRMDSVDVDTVSPYVDALVKFFEVRARRMQHV